ncbi:unnamed protein product, partial [Ectocarpus sp. 8 AP-2014]
ADRQALQYLQSNSSSEARRWYALTPNRTKTGRHSTLLDRPVSEAPSFLGAPWDELYNVVRVQRYLEGACVRTRMKRRLYGHLPPIVWCPVS